MSYGRNPQRSPEEVNTSGKDWFTLYTVFKRAGTSIKRVRANEHLRMAGGSRVARAVTDFFTDQDAVVRDFDDAAASFSAESTTSPACGQRLM